MAYFAIGNDGYYDLAEYIPFQTEADIIIQAAKNILLRSINTIPLLPDESTKKIHP